MKYASVCSGIEAPSMAWHHLGWEPVWFSQYDPEHDYKNNPDFASAVLKHHYPHVPNIGDMTKIHSNEVFNGTNFDLLVGGTPCQSFSVAGLRAGLSDPRGNLALEFVRLLDIKRPRWFVWENVPGVLSSSGGRDFASIIGAFTKIGYSCAWRILDAKGFGVAQRRRRMFVVGHSSDWRRPASVLFDSGCLQGDNKKSGEERESSPQNSRGSSAFDMRGFGDYGNGRTSSTLKRRDFKDATDLVVQPVGYAYSKSHRPNGNVDVRFTQDGKANCLNTGDGCGNQSTMNLIASFDPRSQDGMPRMHQNNICSTLNTMQGGQRQPCVVTSQVPYNIVRRLTPIECERLQGFPDNFTNIPWKGKDVSPDSLRYRALGNSMAVPCMKWIGERIAKADSLPDSFFEFPPEYAKAVL